METLLAEPFSLEYNDPVMARVKLVDAGGWQSLQAASVSLDETVPLRYPPPAYVTGQLTFGDANAEVTFMWVAEGLYAEDDSTGPDTLTAINLSTSPEALIQGIQLVFERSGESPMFHVERSWRMLNETDEASGTLTEPIEPIEPIEPVELIEPTEASETPIEPAEATQTETEASELRHNQTEPVEEIPAETEPPAINETSPCLEECLVQR